MTTNNEYYHQILENLTGYTWSNSLTTNEILNLLAFGYGMEYNCAKCNSKCLKDIATEITGVTQKSNKPNAYYLHKLCEYLTNETYSTDLTDNEYLPIVEANLTGELEVPTIFTSLSITVPLTLVYSDSFNITGVLTDENSNPISNASVQLLVGSTVVDTATTSSNGEVSFTTSPVSMGTHSFQLKYNGDILHLNSSSSIVTRQIGKETSVLNVTAPINQSNHYNDGAVTVSGTLLSDDNEPINGKSITISENGNTLTTITTGNDGSFSGAVSNLAVGSHSFVIAFAGDDYYTGSSSNVSVTLVAASLTLMSDKNILSYADGEYATLTATYVGETVSGKTISFDVVDHDTGTVIRHIDSAVTDENGEASVCYLAEHSNSLYIRASCNDVISTQTFVEYWLYKPKLDGSESLYIESGTASITNNELYGNSAYLTEGWDNTTDWQLEFDFKIDGVGGIYVCVEPSHSRRDTGSFVQIETNNNTITNYRNGSYSRQYRSISKNTWIHAVCIRNGNTLSLTFEGVTTTINWTVCSNYDKLCCGVDGFSCISHIKNIKVKAL